MECPSFPVYLAIDDRNLMKSNSTRRKRRIQANSVTFSEFGIAVFLDSDFVPDALQALAPDFVNWIYPDDQASPVKTGVFTAEISHNKHSGEYKTDDEHTSGPV